MMRTTCALFCLVLVAWGSPEKGDPSRLSIATFTCDVSPPIGHPMAGGLLPAVKAVEPALLAKGVVVSDGTKRTVLCALDWCRLHNEAYDLFRRKLAAGADTSESSVAVQCLHQHDAPVADIGAELLLRKTENPPAQLDLDFIGKVTDKLRDSVREALPRLKPFTHVGWGKGKVEKYASTRRVPIGNGKVRGRGSMTRDPKFQAMTEGKIDPFVRTVTFFNGDAPLVRMHYYACHPQNNYGDGTADPDVFEPVRSRFEEEEGIPQIFFPGCGGDVTVGKYNVGTAMELRKNLTDRMCAGIRESIAATERAPVSKLDWKVTTVRFAFRKEPKFSEEAARKRMGDPKEHAENRLKASWLVSWYERMKTKPEIEVNRLRLGPVDILHLPGEAFVEYQLYAQGVNPDRFVAVAAYGDGGTSYICDDKAFGEGGYEPTVSWVGPPSEQRLKAAIRTLLD